MLYRYFSIYIFIYNYIYLFSALLFNFLFSVETMRWKICLGCWSYSTHQQASNRYIVTVICLPGSTYFKSSWELVETCPWVPDWIGICKCWFLTCFKERGKLEYPEKNPSEQGREPTTTSTHIWRRHWDSNLGHIGGRWVLSLLHHPFWTPVHVLVQLRHFAI